MKVLVIGASRGLGREFVRQYLEAGDAVTATARRPEDVAALEAAGATAFALDVGDAASASSLAWRVDGAGFDVALVVAGVLGPHTAGLDTPSQDDFDAVMRTNVLGPMRVVPQLADALAPGARLAVLSSLMGSIGKRASTATWLYRASKAAVNSVLKDASLAFAGRAICVALHPGWVKTDMGGSGADLTPEKSIADMRRTLAGLGPQDNGRFLNHDGSPLPGEAAMPTAVGETCRLVLTLTEADIRAGAARVHDLNPIHHDRDAARAAGHPGLVASGAHTGSIFMGMTATHFSQPAPGGLRRNMLGLGFEFRFRAVVLADEPLAMRWTVTGGRWKESLRGWIVEAEGTAETPRGVVLEGTTRFLLRSPEEGRDAPR